MKRLPGVRILIVDDDQDTLELARVVLGAEGAEVRCVSNVHDALEVLRGFEADLVLTDIAMPEEDGFALIRTLVAGAPPIPVTRVAVLTACADDATSERALAAGAAVVLLKPFSPEEIVDAVVSYVRPGQSH